jgi:negative regulator of flagellin synthesis FlgM
MEIRNSLDGLKSLLGTTAPAATETKAGNGSSTAASGFAGDHATFSNAASEVSQSLSEPGVRMDKVASVQAALAAGTYNVPASAVAGKMVDAMLGTGG